MEKDFCTEQARETALFLWRARDTRPSEYPLDLEAAKRVADGIFDLDPKKREAAAEWILDMGRRYWAQFHREPPGEK